MAVRTPVALEDLDRLSDALVGLRDGPFL